MYLVTYIVIDRDKEIVTGNWCSVDYDKAVKKANSLVDGKLNIHTDKNMWNIYNDKHDLMAHVIIDQIEYLS